MRITLATDGIALPTAAPVLRVQCHYCGKQVHPREAYVIGESAVQCAKCREKHNVYIANFEAPKECNHCHRKREAIAAASPEWGFRMVLHWDPSGNVYLWLCKPCSDKYVTEQNRQLYRDTRFGSWRKLK